MTNWKKKRPWPHRPLNEGGLVGLWRRGRGVFGLLFFQAYVLGDLHQNKFRIHVQRPQESKIIKLLKNYGPCGFWWPAVQQMGKSHLAGVCCGLTLDSRIFDVLVVTYLHLWHLKEIVPLKGQPTWKASPIVTQPKNVDDSLACYVLTLGNELKVAVGSH